MSYDKTTEIYTEDSKIIYISLKIIKTKSLLDMTRTGIEAIWYIIVNEKRIVRDAYKEDRTEW